MVVFGSTPSGVLLNHFRREMLTIDIFQIIQQNLYVFCAIAAVTVLSVVYAVIRNRSMKKAGANFLELHPDAARVYLTSKALITVEAVTVYTVNGEPPSRFTDGGKTGFYVVPGKSTVEISYSYTRPGVMHKTVTTSTDVVEKILETKPHHSYILGFDRKAESFTFEAFNK